MSSPVPVSVASLPPPSTVVQAAASELSKALEGRVSLEEVDRLSYSRDMWPKAIMWIRQGRIPPPPDAVVWPRNEEEVVAVIRLARKLKVAIIPFGGGSGVVGGICAVRGGIAMDLKRLERVGEVDPDRLCVDAEAGVMGEVLERTLNAQGYTLGHFPSSIYMSTLGGWLAARSAGQLSSKYGKIEDMVLSVRAVTGTGETIATPERPHPGPDLAPLLIGSEGTLCAFTGAKLRVHPLPEARAFRAFHFRNVTQGVEAIRRLFREGLRPAVARLYDPFDTAAAGRGDAEEKKSDVPPSLRGDLRSRFLPAVLRAVVPQAMGRPGILNRAADLLRQCLLVLMFEGEAHRTAREEEQARAFCLASGGQDQGEGPAKHWFETRYNVSYKMSKVLDAGMFADTMEVAVTWDKVLDVYERVRAAASPLAFVMCHFSHAYLEGCSLYFSFVSSASNAEEQERRYDELWRAALEAATSAGANVSHHHGVGLLKTEALQRELGEGGRLLSALKRTFDPDGIMNPGKLGL